jgi:putative transport protein
MEALFKFLAANPYMLLFLAVGLAVWIGRFNVKGYGLGMVAAAIVVGCGMSVWA